MTTTEPTPDDGVIWEHPLSDDMRLVDLNAVIDLLEHAANNQGEVGIWGGYGPPAAPVSFIVGVVLGNAHAVEHRTGEYDEEGER